MSDKFSIDDILAEIGSDNDVSKKTAKSSGVADKKACLLYTSGTEKLGATVIPASAGNSLRQLEMFRDFGTSIICMTPSYAISLIELMHEKGFKKEDFNLKAGLFGAEPGSYTHLKNVRLRKD